MRLSRDNLVMAYHNAMIMQYANELEGNGFVVTQEHGNGSHSYDLYAEKGSDKRIYEFKLVGKNPYVKGQLSRFKEYAASINATPYVVHVNPPMEKSIEMGTLGEVLTAYFIHSDIPGELDSLSTHTSIEAVDVNIIHSVDITKEGITASGEAVISVRLQYGSDADCKRNDGAEDSASFPMSFTVKMSSNFEFDEGDIEYHIDTSSFYE
jgi:hypothetical protein